MKNRRATIPSRADPDPAWAGLAPSFPLRLTARRSPIQPHQLA